MTLRGDPGAVLSGYGLLGSCPSEGFLDPDQDPRDSGRQAALKSIQGAPFARCARGWSPRRTVMASGSPWPTIHTERAALADDLAGLTHDQWETPSLCAPWT